MHLLSEIRSYLDRTNTPPTKLGRMAVGDPRIVFDILNGREPRAVVAEKLRFHMQQHPDGHPRSRGRALPHRVQRRVKIEDHTIFYQQPYKDKAPCTDPCPLCGTSGHNGCRHRAPYTHIELAPNTVHTLDKSILLIEESDIDYEADVRAAQGVRKQGRRRDAVPVRKRGRPRKGAA